MMMYCGVSRKKPRMDETAATLAAQGVPSVQLMVQNAIK